MRLELRAVGVVIDMSSVPSRDWMCRRKHTIEPVATGPRDGLFVEGYGGRHQAAAWPESDVLVRRRAARYSKQARRVYRTLFPNFRKTGPPPRTLFVSRVGTGSPVIRLASTVGTASSSQPGLACKISARDGKAGREGVCIVCSHAVPRDNMGEHRERIPAVSGLLRKCGSAD